MTGEPEFLVVGWDVRASHDVPVRATRMIGGPSKLELDAEVLCRGLGYTHFPHPSKEDICKAFGLLLGVDPERIKVY